MNDSSIKEVMIGLFQQFCDVYTVDRAVVDIQHDIGMHFMVEVSGLNTGYESNGSTHHPEWERHVSKILHIIILSTRRVYVAASNYDIPIDVSVFKNTSNHIDCWRTDGFKPLTSAYFDTLALCRDHVPEPHRLHACSYVSTSLTPRLVAPFRYVRVVRNHSAYFDNLLSIEILRGTMTLSSKTLPLQIEGN